MTLNQLKYFTSICNSNSVCEASEILHISQPSLSIAIKELEKELDVMLFFRRKKRLVLTDEGRYFLKKAIEIVDKANELEENMKNINKLSKKIRVGAPPMVAAYLLSSLIMAFSEQYPSIHIEMMEVDPQKLEHLMYKEQLDFALTNCPSFSNLYQYKPILETELLGCVRKDHKLANKTKVPISMLQNERFILGNSDSIPTRRIQQAFKDESITPTVFMYSTQLHLILHFIQRNGLVSFLADEFVRYNNNVATFELEKPIRLTYALISRKDIHPPNDVARLIDFCESYQLNSFFLNGTQ